MKNILELYYMNELGEVSPFPNSDTHIQIRDFNYSANRMSSAPTISASVMFPSCLDKVWNETVFVTYCGERYYLKNTPTSSKSNDNLMYRHDVTFVSERSILENVYFYDTVAHTDDKPVSNSTRVFFFGSVSDFAYRLNESLKFSGLDYNVVVDPDVNGEEKQITFEDKVFSSVLQEIYNTFNEPYYFEGKTIHIGKYLQSDSLSNMVFDYGAEHNLLSIKKTNTNHKIVNRIAPVGSSENIPYYYPNEGPYGEIEPYVNKGNISIEFDKNVLYDTVALNDVFKATVKDFFVMNNESVDKAKQWLNEGRTAMFSYTLEVKQDMIARVNIPAPMADNVVSSKFEIMEIDETPGSGQTILSHEWTRSNPQTGNFKLSLTNSHHTIYLVFYNETYSTPQDQKQLPTMHNYIAFQSAYWYLSNRRVDITKYGIRVIGEPQSGDEIAIKQIKYINPVRNLMPPVYRIDGKERYYNAINGVYEKEEKGKYYSFKFPYREGFPKEQVQRFEEVKPTIKGMKNEAQLPIDTFVEFAFDEGDNNETEKVNGSLVFKHPYFFAKMKKTDGVGVFNLFDCAIENGPMKIHMTSGVCGGHVFEVGVDTKERKYNLVHVDETTNQLQRYADGPNKGAVICGREGLPAATAQEWQQDTSKREVWIALKKDSTTNEGQVMPDSKLFIPSANDTFVITDIKLPLGYIKAAEERLKHEGLQFMENNNTEKFGFSIKFSRIYLENHPEIRGAINENTKIKVRYDGVIYELFVNSYSCKVSSSELLPEITVELKDEIILVQSSLQQTINEVKQNVIYQINEFDYEKAAGGHFISKTRNDYADGSIKFRNKQYFEDGAEFGEFEEGSSGGAIDKEGNAELSNLKIRGSLQTMEYIINRLQAIEGDRILTEADTIERVDDFGDGRYGLQLQSKWEGYFTAQVADNVIKGIVNDIEHGQDYATSWMKVTSVNALKNYIYATTFPDNAVPGGKNNPPVRLMKIARWGNQKDEARQSSIYLSSLKEQILFLKGLNTPFVNDFNYSMALGKLPQLEVLKQIGLDGTYGVYAQSVVAENLKIIDWNGDVVSNKVDRGEWSLETAQKVPYRYIYNKKQYEDGYKYTELEQHTVYHYGCKWGCMVDKTIEEPIWDSASWVLLEGDPNYYLDFESTNGWHFRLNGVDTEISAIVTCANQEITSSLLAKPDTVVEWKRDTNNPEDDATWKPEYVGEDHSRIHLTRNDMGLGWGTIYRDVSFTCTFHLKTGNTFKQVTNNIKIKL